MIKVIAVDFGGVYFTWNFEKYTRRMAAAIGVDYPAARKALSLRLRDFQVQKITEKEYWGWFCRAIGKEMDHQLLKKITYRNFKPQKPVITLVSRLRGKYKVALLSNTTVQLDEFDKEYGIYRNFDLVLSSHIVKMQKPDKEIFELLIRKTGARPQEIVFIDDTEENIEAAGKVGINTILFRDVRQLRKELAGFGVRA